VGVGGRIFRIFQISIRENTGSSQILVFAFFFLLFANFRAVYSFELTPPEPSPACHSWLQKYQATEKEAFVARFLPKPIFRKHLQADGRLPFSASEIDVLFEFINTPRTYSLDFRQIFNALPSYIGNPQHFVSVFRAAMKLESDGYKIVGLMKVINDQEVDLILSRSLGRALLIEFKAKLNRIAEKSRAQFLRLQKMPGMKFRAHETEWVVESVAVAVTSPGSSALSEVILQSEYGFQFWDLSAGR